MFLGINQASYTMIEASAVVGLDISNMNSNFYHLDANYNISFAGSTSTGSSALVVGYETAFLGSHAASYKNITFSPLVSLCSYYHWNLQANQLTTNKAVDFVESTLTLHDIDQNGDFSADSSLIQIKNFKNRGQSIISNSNIDISHIDNINKVQLINDQGDIEVIDSSSDSVTASEERGLSDLTVLMREIFKKIGFPIVQSAQAGNNSQSLSEHGVTHIGNQKEPSTSHDHLFERGNPENEYIPDVPLDGPKPDEMFDMMAKTPNIPGNQKKVPWEPKQLEVALQKFKKVISKYINSSEFKNEFGDSLKRTIYQALSFSVDHFENITRKVKISYKEALLAQKSLEDKLLESPNVVSVSIIEDKNNLGEESDGYAIKVGVISEEIYQKELQGGLSIIPSEYRFQPECGHHEPKSIPVKVVITGKIKTLSSDGDTIKTESAVQKTAQLAEQKTTKQFCNKPSISFIKGPIKINQVSNFFKVYKNIIPATKEEIIANEKQLAKAHNNQW